MPHLQFELNFSPNPQDKQSFAHSVRQLFARIMNTGTDHIGITLRCYSANDLVFGRAGNGKIAFLNADIRVGRSAQQKRQLGLEIMAELSRLWEIPKESIYVIYTEHDGPDFQLSDRVLPSWQAGEDPLKD
ncbi:MAG: tautomerase [Deltaproteobacteria bacterium]|jgi:phenylpyruvate tautomerase PptA (4-oxalocrotonate tautomerase family)|nr:tautomerase [Deltaproteobacteria bacterium]MBW2503606.1 tautomerase [Deltaproteobacteria bacterium]MBW2519607.1 tautomerase [Deltaproteobacteria bacterium]